MDTEIINDETDSKRQPAPTWVKVLLTIILSAGVTLIIVLLDVQCNNSRIYVKLNFKPDCGYGVPWPYKIVEDTAKHRYAVRDIRYTDLFLQTPGYRRKVENMYSSIGRVTYFSDTCMAKAVIKRYVYQQQPKANNFKE